MTTELERRLASERLVGKNQGRLGLVLSSEAWDVVMGARESSPEWLRASGSKRRGAPHQVKDRTKLVHGSLR